MGDRVSRATPEMAGTSVLVASGKPASRLASDPIPAAKWSPTTISNATTQAR